MQYVAYYNSIMFYKCWPKFTSIYNLHAYANVAKRK